MVKHNLNCSDVPSPSSSSATSSSGHIERMETSISVTGISRKDKQTDKQTHKHYIESMQFNIYVSGYKPKNELILWA